MGCPRTNAACAELMERQAVQTKIDLYNFLGTVTDISNVFIGSGIPVGRLGVFSQEASVYLRGILNISKVLKYTTTSGAKLVATTGKTTTVLGRYGDDIQYIIKELDLKKSLDFGAKSGGFNVLNAPDDLYKTADQFWKEFNKPFLDQAMARGDEIIMATKPTIDKLYYAGTKELTGFGREFKYLTKNGYSYDSAANKMIKK